MMPPFLLGGKYFSNEYSVMMCWNVEGPEERHAREACIAVTLILLSTHCSQSVGLLPSVTESLPLWPGRNNSPVPCFTSELNSHGISLMLSFTQL